MTQFRDVIEIHLEVIYTGAVRREELMQSCKRALEEVVPILRASEIPYRINSLIQTHKILINRCL